MFDVCVTIVNTNETELIKNCLKTLYADNVGSGLNIYTVIIDNASTENPSTILRDDFSQLNLILQKKNLGFGKSHNVAMRSVDAKYYFILNPDTTFEFGQGFFHRMYDFMEAHQKIGVAGPKIVYPDGSLQYSCYRFPSFWQPVYSRTGLGRSGRGKMTADRFLMKDLDHNKTAPVDWVMGSAMFVRKRAIDEVGMFDDRFWMYAEDSDWCRRMWEHGWAVYYVHDIILKHLHIRASAKIPGIINALLKNKFARAHLISWLKYFWKWRGNHRYYVEKWR